MPDFEKELDATVAKAKAVMDEGARLSESAVKVRQEREEWEKANGITEEKRQRFFAALPATEQQKVQEEQDAFDRDLAHDLAAAADNAETTKATGERKGKRRSYA